MTDRKALPEQNDTPEDVATLYSWANLHGAKYRDFSASRARTREKARLRVLQAAEDVQQRAQSQVEAEHSAQLRLAAESAQSEEQSRREQAAREQAVRQEAARQAAQLVAQQAAQMAAQQAAERNVQDARAAEQARATQFAAGQAQAARQSAELAWAAQRAAEQAQSAQRAVEEARAMLQAAEQTRAAQFAAEQAHSAQRAAQEARAQQQAAEQARATQFAADPAHSVQRAAPDTQSTPQAAQQIRAAQQAAWQQQRSEPHPPDAAPAPVPQNSYFAPQNFASTAPAMPAYRPSQAFPAAVAQPAYAPPPAREVPRSAPHPGWGAPDFSEAASRPAWLNTDRPVDAPVPAPAMLPLAAEVTLQGQRDRLTSRWFALKSVFHGGVAPVEPAPALTASRAPVMAIFSLAGGVGKTSLTATLGRALSARGERVLLVDTAPYGLLPFYFGARDQRPGQLRTFTAPGTGGDAPIQMVTVDPDALGPEVAQQEPLVAEIGKYAAGVSRVIVDLATASGATTRRVLRMAPLVLVPVMPDMNSVVSVSAIDSFFQRIADSSGPNAMPFYVLNQFDASLPLHLDVREVLREQLGERLLPFALRRAPAVSEALAEGMTVVDYAPSSTVAEDFGNLAGWVKSQSAPASSGFCGVRWSEK